MNDHPTPWTPPVIELLNALLVQRPILTYRQIAARLSEVNGWRFTKNSVIGYAKRNGIPNRNPPQPSRRGENSSPGQGHTPPSCGSRHASSSRAGPTSCGFGSCCPTNACGRSTMSARSFSAPGPKPPAARTAGITPEFPTPHWQGPMKQIVHTDSGWWIAWPSTGNDALLNWIGPYRWRWLAVFRRWWWFR